MSAESQDDTALRLRPEQRLRALAEEFRSQRESAATAGFTKTELLTHLKDLVLLGDQMANAIIKRDL